jgi:hypothetical protein
LTTGGASDVTERSVVSQAVLTRLAVAAVIVVSPGLFRELPESP